MSNNDEIQRLAAILRDDPGDQGAQRELVRLIDRASHPATEPVFMVRNPAYEMIPEDVARAVQNAQAEAHPEMFGPIRDALETDSGRELVRGIMRSALGTAMDNFRRRMRERRQHEEEADDE